MRKTLLALGCVAALVFTGCTGESSLPVATGKGTLRAINAIPTSPAVLFAIEERSIGTVDYSNLSNQVSFDDLEYTFNFEVLLAGDLLQTRVASTVLKVERDTEYTFLISGELATPTITVWETAIREWEGTETVFQARFAHTAESLGPIDVYFAAPGVAPVLGQQAGTISFTEFLSPVEYEAGDFVVTFTTAGDPNDVLFTSDTITPVAQAGFTMAIFDSTANDAGPVSVRLIMDFGGASRVPDINVLPTVRLFHAATNLETADIYVDELLTDQLLADHTFRDVTGDIDLAADVYTFTYTAAGNVGAILFEGTAAVLPGVHSQIYIVTDTLGELVSFIRLSERRPIETIVQLSYVHAAANHPLVDVYIVDAGIDIADAVPRFFNLSPGLPPVTTNLQDGDFEIYLTVAAEKTVIAGPVALTTALGDIVDYIAYDNVGDPSIADLVLIPLP